MLLQRRQLVHADLHPAPPRAAAARPPLALRSERASTDPESGVFREQLARLGDDRRLHKYMSHPAGISPVWLEGGVKRPLLMIIVSCLVFRLIAL